MKTLLDPARLNGAEDPAAACADGALQAPGRKRPLDWSIAPYDLATSGTAPAPRARGEPFGAVLFRAIERREGEREATAPRVDDDAPPEEHAPEPPFTIAVVPGPPVAIVLMAAPPVTIAAMPEPPVAPATVELTAATAPVPEPPVTSSLVAELDASRPPEPRDVFEAHVAAAPPSYASCLEADVDAAPGDRTPSRREDVRLSSGDAAAAPPTAEASRVLTRGPAAGSAVEQASVATARAEPPPSKTPDPRARPEATPQAPRAPQQPSPGGALRARVARAGDRPGAERVREPARAVWTAPVVDEAAQPRSAPEVEATTPAILASPEIASSAAMGVGANRARSSSASEPASEEHQVRERLRDAAVKAVNQLTLRHGVHAEVDLPGLGRIVVGARARIGAPAAHAPSVGCESVDVHVKVEQADVAHALRASAAELVGEVRAAQVPLGRLTLEGPDGRSTSSFDAGGRSQSDGSPHSRSNGGAPPAPSHAKAASAARRRVRIVL